MPDSTVIKAHNALYNPTRESAISWQEYAHHRAADAVLALPVGDVQGAIEAQADAAFCAARAMDRLNRLIGAAL